MAVSFKTKALGAARCVLFIRTAILVQRLQLARRELKLESAIARLHKYHVLILDDLACVIKDQVETSQPFGEWGKNFPDPVMTVAAVDCLVPMPPSSR